MARRIELLIGFNCYTHVTPQLQFSYLSVCSVARKDSSNGKSVGLVIERLLTLGSIPDLEMRHCVLEDTLRLFLSGAKQSTRYGGPADERLANRTPKKCSALVWFDRRRVPSS